MLLNDGLSGDPISVDTQDPEFLAQIDAALKLSPLHAVGAYGSLHVLSKEKLQKGSFSLIVGGRSYLISVEDTPERVHVDEICTSVEGCGMASVRLFREVVHLLPLGVIQHGPKKLLLRFKSERLSFLVNVRE